MVKINWICFGHHSGYSQAAQDMILALYQSGKYDVRVQYIHAQSLPQSGLSSERIEIFKSLIEKKQDPERITVYHCIPTAQRHIQPNRRTIGYAMFETFNPPNEGATNWISLLNRNDVIITPSQFNYRIFAHEKLTKPLFYVPCCYDRTLFHPEVESLEAKSDLFTFCYFGTWRQRKGYPALLEAFLREFEGRDHVRLVIKTDKPQQAYAAVLQMKQNLGLMKKDTAPILFERRVFDDVSLPRFLKSIDCLIAPTLGEGFGLPGLQCMALGVPVAITDFSGCKDYANEETCTLIKPSGFTMYAGMDGLPQFANRKWALVTATEVARVMRHVLSNQAEIEMKAKHAQTFVAKEFSYENSEKLFSEMLRTTFNVQV